jgi:hypothetical protein
MSINIEKKAAPQTSLGINHKSIVPRTSHGVLFLPPLQSFHPSSGLTDTNRYQMTITARPLQHDTQPHMDNLKSRENVAVNVDILPFEEKVCDGQLTNGSADAAAQVQRKLKQRHISMIAMAGERTRQRTSSGVG